MIKTLLAVSALSLVACTNPDSATLALLDAGYGDITITGYNWYGCSKDDTYYTGITFTATGPTGRRTSGTVCSGWMKGSTIRFD